MLGDIGTGKTTLSRALIQQFQNESDRFLFHLVLDPSFSSESDFLYSLAMGFGISLPDADSLFAYKEAIRQFLLRSGHQKDRVIVLIVDEGQKLNDNCLELLRDLLNFETNQYKLLQLIIMAQKELDERIRLKRNLTDRINTFHILGPLDRKETQDMIEFRLNRAGWSSKAALFSSDAIDIIYHYSGGYPRKIITFCHHSLLCMLIKNAQIVEPEMVEYAVSQMYEYNEDSHKILTVSATKENLPSKFNVKPLKYKPKRSFNLKWLYASVLPAAVLILFFVTLFWGTKSMKQARLGIRKKSASFVIKPGVIANNADAKLDETESFFGKETAANEPIETTQERGKLLYLMDKDYKESIDVKPGGTGFLFIRKNKARGTMTDEYLRLAFDSCALGTDNPYLLKDDGDKVSISDEDIRLALDSYEPDTENPYLLFNSRGLMYEGNVLTQEAKYSVPYGYESTEQDANVPAHKDVNEGVKEDLETEETGISTSLEMESEYKGLIIQKDPYTEDRWGVMITAKSGDFVLGLARKVYDIEITPSVLKKIQQANPQIKDIDHIKVGQGIFFPDFWSSSIEKDPTDKSAEDYEKNR